VLCGSTSSSVVPTAGGDLRGDHEAFLPKRLQNIALAARDSAASSAVLRCAGTRSG
jgi:hypothetical protein